ncbi:MAG: radical SAM protein [Hyphomicrobiales bacterium]|nr:radical SAM protein [Hyphomicrobiales bacterium]
MTALQYIFKLNNYCNLNCSYCYQSFSAYKSFNTKPVHFDSSRMLSCAEAAFKNVSEHWGHGFLPHMSFVLQGGEPLLIGKEGMNSFLKGLRHLEDKYAVQALLNIHCNGTRIDPEYCEIFIQHDCSVTVSLDGPAEFHDEERVDHLGMPTHEQVVKGLKTSLEAGVDTGCMCVVSPDADGATTQRFFEYLGIKRIGYILPTFEQGENLNSGKYGRFLKDAFDAWLESENDNVRVQFFDATLRAIAGKASGLAGIGGYKSEWITVAADGKIETGDPFGLCEFEKLGTSPNDGIIKAQQNPFYRLQAEGGFIPTKGPCESCDVRDICQGGFLAHRHSDGGNFNKPSYYCDDLHLFFSHVKSVSTGLVSEHRTH